MTASLKPAVMRSTLSELGAPLDDGEGGTLGRAASMLQRNNVESVSPSIFSFYTLDVWSELVGDSDEPLEYDIWLKSESIETCFFFLRFSISSKSFSISSSQPIVPPFPAILQR